MFEEPLDKFTLRIIFSGLFIGILYLYRYAHKLLYPSVKKQMLQKFYPSINSSDTIHYVARIIGFGIVFSQVHIDLKEGILFAVVKLLFQAVLICGVYLISLVVAEHIALYNFTYSDEITKRKNLCYGTIHFAQSVAVAFIVREIFLVANHSLVSLLFLWLFSSVSLGVAIKLFRFYSKLSFNKLVTQKNMALAFSYAGYILGCSLLISSMLSKGIHHIGEYAQLMVLKVLLTVLIFPLLLIGLRRAFLLQEPNEKVDDHQFDPESPELGCGIYEGAVFLSSSLLTVVITRQIFFGYL